jgi:hypothetical protein
MEVKLMARRMLLLLPLLVTLVVADGITKQNDEYPRDVKDRLVASV